MFYTMKPHEMPPLDILRRYFRIDAHARLERWTPTHGWRLCSKIRGKSKYFTVCFEGKTFPAHRVIWTLHNGRPPVGIIDHINGQPWDNRPENLRDVDHQQNRWNTAPYGKNKTGFPNVIERGGRFQAKVGVRFGFVTSPFFDDAEMAGLAAQELIRRHRGEFARRAA